MTNRRLLRRSIREKHRRQVTLKMMQTLAAVCITWGFFHASLHPHQVITAIILIAAVAMVHHVQQQVGSHSTESAPS
jgi:hypothetical protein